MPKPGEIENIDPKYDLREWYDWFAGGKAGDMPNKYEGDLSKLAIDLIIAMNTEYSLNPWKLEDDFPEAFKHIFDTAFPAHDGYVSIDGIWFTSTMNMSESTTPLVYDLLGDITPEEYFSALEKEAQAVLIFDIILASGALVNKNPDTKVKESSYAAARPGNKRPAPIKADLFWPRTRTWEVDNPGTKTAGRGGTVYVGRTYKWEYNTPGKKYDRFLRVTLNEILLQTGSSVNIYKPLEDQRSEAAVEMLDPSDAAGYSEEELLDALREQIKKDHDDRTSLSLQDALEKTGEGGEEALNALFKNLEQCFLLTVTEPAARHRAKLRHTNINDTSAAEDGMKPYGGRIIPYNCEPIQNFMNWGSTTGELYGFTRYFNKAFSEALEHSIMISGVKKEIVSGETIEVEQPLLFGGQKDILIRKEVIQGTELLKAPENEKDKPLPGAVSGSYIKYTSEGVERIPQTEEERITAVLGASDALNNQISYKNISIDFSGENQATATTNVDVVITMQMPNINFLQTEFEGSTMVKLRNGKEVPFSYKYSPVDLLTYLNRGSISTPKDDLSFLKYQGGARLFNPKFFKNYNRLVLKVFPTFNEKKYLASTSLDQEIFQAFSDYLNNNILVLDLALIDHTITRGVKVTAGESCDELQITYKGYIRSYLQDPIFDILRTPVQMKSLMNKEKTLIKKLAEMPAKTTGQRKLVEDAISKHNVTIGKLIKDHKNKFKQNLFRKIQQNNQIWRYNYEASPLLDYNISKTFEIKNAEMVHEYFKAQTPYRIGGLTLDSTTVTEENQADKQRLDYVYFGDLCDALMNNIYTEARDQNGATGVFEKMDTDYKNFPLKVLLPSFYPVVYKKADDMWDLSDKKINLADFPISLNWISEWIDAEITSTDTAFYSLGPFINNIISSLINGFLIDDCFMNGVSTFLQFAVKSEFGLFGGKVFSGAEKTFRQENKTWWSANMFLTHGRGGTFDRLCAAEVTEAQAPYFKKDISIPKVNHCNYLVIYQQTAVFSNYAELIGKSEYFEKYGIPYFNILSETPESDKNVLSTSMSFTKATATYQRESRFQMESLYSLSQLASVYNVSVETAEFLINVFPGMLIFCDAGLDQDSTVVGSMPNTLGMGGYHLTSKVSHTADISGNKLINTKSTITANWIYSGAPDKGSS